MEVNTVMNWTAITKRYIQKDSPFRQYITEKWYEHKKEVLTWESKVVDYTQQEWFEKNRWYLKKLYKEK